MLKVKIEKSELALKLEKELGISWDLVQQYSYDAGYDLRACINKPIDLFGLQRCVIPTGLFIEMDGPYWEIQVRPRSGLAWKYGITIVNSPGTVDYLYREEMKVILLNTTQYGRFIIHPGDRIAQACFRQIPEVSFQYVKEIEHTARGGFGSTGNK